MKYEASKFSVPDPDLGLKIKQRRRSLKMTQKDLAAILGVTFQQVQKYEKGSSNITMSTFLNICKGLKVQPGYFIDSISFFEGDNEQNIDLEKKLLSIFRSIENGSVKARIIELISTVASTFSEP